MKNKIKEIIKNASQNRIKVRLDYKTFMTLSNLSSLDHWLIRYPDAKVISR